MQKNTDSNYMQMALELALKAKGKTSPNPLVGAVIVKGGKIVGKGFHRKCGSDHAEIVALKEAGKRAKGAILYVTLEPCGHIGRTPPCVDAIIRSGIKEVVIGSKDPNKLNNGKSISRLRRSGIKTSCGILKKDLQRVNEDFFKFIQCKMPFVVVKCAQTLDGKIATSSGHSKWITDAKTRRYAHHIRNDFDAILVGINTIVKDNPFLNAGNKAKRLKKIVVDSTLKIPLGANIFKKTNPRDIVIATTRRANQKRLKALIEKKCQVLILSDIVGCVNLKALLKQLGKKEISSVLVEGGSKIVGSILKQKLADKALVFIAPKIVGDQNAISSVRGLNVKNINNALKLKDICLYPLGSDILVEGYIK